MRPPITMVSFKAIAPNFTVATGTAIAAFGDVDADMISDLVLLSADSPTELIWLPGLAPALPGNVAASYGAAAKVPLDGSIQTQLKNPLSLSLGPLDAQGQLGAVVATQAQIVVLKFGATG